jgi:hypothetical protein
MNVYHDHFHDRILSEIRERSLVVAATQARREKEQSDRVEKAMLIQLVRDRNILSAKLNQFDRMSQNHHEAVMRRELMKTDIGHTLNDFFGHQEEIQLMEYNRVAIDTERRTREVRMQLAEGFLYHLGRAVRSYDNQVIAHQYCLAFRLLSDPIVEKAVGYFYEKRHITSLMAVATKQRNALKAVVKCSCLYHKVAGWKWWRSFIQEVNVNRSQGLMLHIRRRAVVLKLYPYFNWTEVLPVRPPKPLKEVAEQFKDLPLVSIQRKLARERIHHVNVKRRLQRRRILRDFVRTWAGYVQSQVAMREVIRLMIKKRGLATYRRVFEAFRSNWKGAPMEPDLPSDEEKEISGNIDAWFRHFFRERTRQNRMIKELPIT